MIAIRTVRKTTLSDGIKVRLAYSTHPAEPRADLTLEDPKDPENFRMSMRMSRSDIEVLMALLEDIPDHKNAMV